MGSGGKKNRASRWYGNRQRSLTDKPADVHPNAEEWDNPVNHRNLLERLVVEYDGWAIATSPDGISAYGPLPPEVRIMAWVRPNAQPGAHRLRSCWEAVLLSPPVGRRSNRGVGSISDVLVANVERGFRGRKPQEWTHWVLSALSYNRETDVVDDLFHGSGSVAEAVLSFHDQWHTVLTSSRESG